MSRKVITAPDGAPSLTTADAVYATGMGSPSWPRKRASSSRTVRPVRMASMAGTSRKSGAIGAPSPTGSSIVMSSDGSSIRPAAARLTNVSRPPASMAQTPSPMLRVIEESLSRSM